MAAPSIRSIRAWKGSDARTTRPRNLQGGRRENYRREGMNGNNGRKIYGKEEVSLGGKGVKI